MSIEQKVIELTSDQIQSLLVGRAFGFIVSIFVLGAGLFLSKGGIKEIKGYIGLVLSILGALGVLTFLLGLIEVINLLLDQ